MICPKCTKEIPENSIFCNYCGEQINKEKISMVRLIKNIFAIVIFVLSLVALVIPIGSTNSTNLFSKLNHHTSYKNEFQINYVFWGAFDAGAYLNDDLTNAQAVEEVFNVLEKHVDKEILDKYRNQEELSDSERRDLQFAFYFVNPYIFLSVERTRDVSQVIIFFLVSMIVASIVLITANVVFIILAIIDIRKPKYGVAVRKTVLLNSIFGIANFLIYIIINQLNQFAMGPSTILYLVVSVFGFLVMYLFKHIKTKRFEQLNLPLLIKHIVRTATLVVVVVLCLTTVFTFTYHYTNNNDAISAINDSDGITSLFEISNYKNVRAEELNSFEKEFTNIIAGINNNDSEAAAARLKDFSTVFKFATTTDMIEGDYSLVIATMVLPYIILIIMVLTFAQLYISLSNLYYGTQKHKRFDSILNFLKIIGVVYILVSSALLINKFNELALFYDIKIDAIIGDSPIISIVLIVFDTVFSYAFNPKNDEIETDEFII